MEFCQSRKVGALCSLTCQNVRQEIRSWRKIRHDMINEEKTKAGCAKEVSMYNLPGT